MRGFYQFTQNVALLFGVILIGRAFHWPELGTVGLFLVAYFFGTVLLDIRGLLLDSERARRELNE